MRWRYLLVFMLGWCLSGTAWAVEFPYVAYVNSADVYVRSGPGRNYYPTDKLRKGEQVEIYRHDPGGWYAIRPPRQSFAWVSRRHLDPQPDGLAIVNSQRVVARVGSSLSDVREVIQVRLDKGEKVELLEPPAEASPWCKIAPPSGEFRWIFAKFVDREVPDDIAQGEREAAAGQGYADARRADLPERDIRLASAADASQSAPHSNETHSSEPEASEPRTELSHQRRNVAGEAALERDLDRIEMELSAIVVQDVSAWSFADLQRRGETLLRESQTSIERGRARVLLGKLARFEDIKLRHDASRQGAPAVDPRMVAAGASDARRADAARFDGVGRLSPVISEKVGGPQFALVDASNAVVSFVTPAPGVNLRPFVDHYVGVNGQRGYMTDLQRQHIHAQRITVLDVERR